MGADLTQVMRSLPATRAIRPDYRGRGGGDFGAASVGCGRDFHGDAAATGMPDRTDRAVRTYQVRTYGCQMNVHDSERLAGLLEAAGYRRAADGADADVVVFNTCAVRENADNKLYGNLSHLAPRKQADPDMQIAVGGCLAQKDRDTVLRKAPWVDVVFGTHNIGSLPDAAGPRPAQQDGAGRNRRGAAGVPVRICRPRANPPTPHGFPSRSAATTPARSASCPRCAARRSTAGPATCSPRCSRWWTRACSRSRCWAERQRLRRVVRRPRSAARPRRVRASCCAPAGGIDGLERVRFTSPHPAEFTDDVIEAMAETPNVCPTLHMPLQSGSDRILRAMRRSYRCRALPGHHRPGARRHPARRHHHRPDRRVPRRDRAGLPGHPRRGRRRPVQQRVHVPVLEATRHPGCRARLVSCPKAVVQERYQRLIELQERISLEENAAQIGRTVELLVATGEGRKDARTARMSGRARDGRLVHFEPGRAPTSGPATSSSPPSPAPHRTT